MDVYRRVKFGFGFFLDVVVGHVLTTVSHLKRTRMTSIS